MDASDPSGETAAAAVLQAYILEHIPLARAMQVAVTRYDGDDLEMRAPLAPNRNDKGCAFGGSMASLLTLAGWGLIELNLRARGWTCDLYVGDSQVRYLAPVWGELRGSARFAAPDALNLLVSGLRERGKGRAAVICEIAGRDGPAATLGACFFARPRA